MLRPMAIPTIVKVATVEVKQTLNEKQEALKAYK